MPQVLYHNIQFASAEGEFFKDSFGGQLIVASQPATTEYTFKIGSFANDFVPTFENIDYWHLNWRTFEVADFNAPPPVIGFVDVGLTSAGTTTSTNPLADTDFNFFGQEAYLWIANSYDLDFGTEWFLGRAPDWEFPDFSDDVANGCADCGSGLPTSLAISDITESNQVPIWGGQTGIRGDGLYEETDDTWDIQTFGLPLDVIPEPSSVFLVAAIGAVVFFNRFNPFKRNRS